MTRSWLSLRKVNILPCLLVLIVGWMVVWLVLQDVLTRHGGLDFAHSKSKGLLDFLEIDSNMESSIDNMISSSHGRIDVGYVVDSVCRGCRHAVADPNDMDSERCGVYIQQKRTELLLQSGHTSDGATRSFLPLTYQGTMDEYTAMAANMVAQQYPLGCRECRVNNRPGDHDSTRVCDRRYWMYDAAAPTICASHTRRETWFPHSFDTSTSASSSYRRLSAQAIDNLTAYFNNPHNVYPQAEYFMEYNPSIVVLPSEWRHMWTKDDTSALRSLYLLSFRVSNQHYCFRPVERKLMQGERGKNSDAKKKSKGQKATSPIPKDYLGLVIVDATDDNEWRILADTIVDVNHVASLTNAKGQDYRLAVLHNRVHLSSNDWIAPLSLAPPSASSIHDTGTSVVVPPVFESAETVQFQVAIDSPTACAPCSRGTNRGSCGKNFNYFVASTEPAVMGDTTALVEIWPTGPHIVRTVHLNQPCQRQLNSTTFVDDNLLVAPLTSSFATIEEVDFAALRRRESLLTRGRGSACCVPLLDRRTNRTLLVGIQHGKTPSQGNRKLPANVTSNHYLSSLYAFEATEPYRIVAQSGWFCLGFPRANDDDVNAPLLVRATAWRTLALGQRTFRCPRIHFISGMTVKANDPQTVIIAYGINDCLARFVEVRLDDLQALLFQGPSFQT